jgi:FG-GAP-like repeat
MRGRAAATALVCLSVVAGCGGGGSQPATYTVGGSVSGLGGSGLRLQLNGSNDLSVASSGAFTFASALAVGVAYAVTVAVQPNDQTCTVASGTGTVGSSSVSSVAVTCGDAVLPPLAVQDTSYKNFKQIGLVPQTLPPSTNNARAYADFFGRGRLDLFTTELTYSPTTSTPATATPSVFKMWHRQADGTFVQRSGDLSVAGCIHPRKAVVADFNLDGRPDIFVACHGYDAAPFPGEHSKLVLSQADGTFVVQDASSDVGFFHSATAADLNGDGLPDVVVTDTLDAASMFVLLNQGGGRFQREQQSRVPSFVAGPKSYFTVELVDVNEDGKLDLLVGGHEFENGTTALFVNPGANDFSSVVPTLLPTVANEGVVLDFAVTGAGSERTLWLLRTSGGDGTFYASRVVQKVLVQTLASSVPLNARPAQWVPWIIPAAVNAQALIVSDDASMALSLPQ